MQSIELDEGLCQYIISHLSDIGVPTRSYYYHAKKGSWKAYRFFDISTAFPEGDIKDICYGYHFDWHNSNVKLFLRNNCKSHIWREFRKHIKSKTENISDLVWEDQYTCRFDKDICSKEDLIGSFEYLASVFDPLIQEYFSIREEHTKYLAFGEGKAYSPQTVDALECYTQAIKDLDFSSFTIPPYQRTYKWQRANVNQLINDIFEYGDTPYRLGSLVLHNSEIVDGQQRIVTIAMLLHQMMLNETIRSHTEYQSLFDSVIGFWGRTSYKNKEALNNVVLNLDVIRNRSNELDFNFFKRLVENCEFVVIKLPTIQEAFQFFDSQNARGKDLEAHDLLKAFHLREIDDKYSHHDSGNIAAWEQAHTDLIPLFLCLYRIRKWSKGESARAFSKQDVGEFKGLSLKRDRQSLLPLYNPSYFLNKLFADFYDPGAPEDGSEQYPFQLTGHIINGTRFFDMILHYHKLYQNITDKNWSGYGEASKDLISLLNSYDGVSRVGDEYVRNIFDALVLFYVDRFGTADIDKATEKFFLYAYSIRLTQYRVSLATIDNEMLSGRMFRKMREAVTQYDVLNEYIPSVESKDLASNRSAQLEDRFEDLKKIRHE